MIHDEFVLGREDNLDSNKSFGRLRAFMDKFRVGKGEACTHTDCGRPWGRYNIPDDEYPEFINSYYESIGRAKHLHITERPREVGPLLFDIDFNLGAEYDIRQYTYDTIKGVISSIHKVIRKYYDWKTTPQIMRAFVFEKAEPTYNEAKDLYKDGFHIMYPYLACSRGMRFVILDEVKQMVKENKILNNIPFTNPYDDVFDKSIVWSNGWMMYGSCKEGSQPYHLTHIVKNNIEAEFDVNEFKHKMLPKILSNRRYTEDKESTFKDDINRQELQRVIDTIEQKYGVRKNKPVKQTKFEECNDNDDDYGDAVLSDDDAPSSKSKPKEPSKSNSERLDELAGPSKKTYTQREIFENEKRREIKLIKEIVPVLSKERASSYQDWIRVCWALKSTSKQLKSAWLEFSRKCPQKFNKTECEKLWDDSLDDGNFTGSSIHWWAKQDDPENYARIVRDNINECFKEAETGLEYDIAKLIFTLYKHQYKCVSLERKIWYEFQGHRWVSIEKGHTLKTKMSEDIIRDFCHLSATYYMSASVADGGMSDSICGKAQKIDKIIRSLKKPGFKNRVMEECESMFFDKKFEEELDTNCDLIGFDNGVYDLANMCFRDGTPDDMISMSTGYDYEEFSYDHKLVKEIEDYFAKVMIDPNMRNYVLRLLASFLDGHVDQEQFAIWTGTGANGKSKTVELLQLALGQYGGVMANTVLTRRQADAGRATPELADKKGVRFLVLQEPEGDDQIYVGRMKEFTGGDEITGRALYSGVMFKYKPQFKLLLTCNKLPNIPSNDGGTWRRLRVTEWKSEFVKASEVVEPHQFARDNRLPEKFRRWKRAFMWYLLDKYYRLYRFGEDAQQTNSGLQEPAEVTKYTENYRKDSDSFLEFIQDNLDVVPIQQYEHIDFLYRIFKDWHKNSHPGGCNVAKRDLLRYFKDNKYKIKNNHVLGVQIKDFSSKHKITVTDDDDE